MGSNPGYLLKYFLLFNRNSERPSYLFSLRAGSQTLKNITPEEFKILEDFKNEHVQNNPEDHGMPVEEFVEFMKENEAVKNIVLKLAETK